MVDVRPAATLEPAALAALFTAGYEGYWFPIALDEAGFMRMVAEMDVDLELSRVALDEGRAVGIALLARRAAAGWIGGMGVVADRRRRGIGEATLVATLDAGSEAGLERVTLEVLEQNVRARTLYERLGFAIERDLEVWHLAGTSGGAGGATLVDARAAHDWLCARRVESEPWQRADGTLSHLDGASGLVVDGAAAVVRVTDGKVSVVQLDGETDALVALLAAARSLGESLTVLNLPTRHPGCPALARLGGEVRARQNEMALWLASG